MAWSFWRHCRMRRYWRAISSTEAVNSHCFSAISSSVMMGSEIWMTSRADRVLRPICSAMEMISWMTSGARESDLRTVFWPRSMRRAISTSPSRVSSGTVPISRRYMRTGSLTLSPTPAGSSRSRISSDSSSFFSKSFGSSRISMPATSRPASTSSSSPPTPSSLGRTSVTSSYRTKPFSLPTCTSRSSPSNFSSIATEAPSLPAEKNPEHCTPRRPPQQSCAPPHAQAVQLARQAQRVLQSSGPLGLANLPAQIRAAVFAIGAPQAFHGAGYDFRPQFQILVQHGAREQVPVVFGQPRVHGVECRRAAPIHYGGNRLENPARGERGQDRHALQFLHQGGGFLRARHQRIEQDALVMQAQIRLGLHEPALLPLRHGFLEAFEHHASIDTDIARELARDDEPFHAVGNALHGGHQGLQHRDLPLGGPDIILASRAVRQPMKVALSAGEPFGVAGRAALLAVFIGVEAAIEREDAHLHAFGEQQVNRLLGGIGARRVGIEIDDDVGRELPDRLHVLCGQRRTAGCHDGGEARGGHTDRIHVAFDQDDAVLLAHALFRPVQIVEHVALLIYRRFRRVQVLGLIVGGQRASAEGDDAAAAVVDRKHQAVAEDLVGAAVVALAHQAGLFDQRGRELALLEEPQQRAAAAVRVAQPELIGGFRRHAAFGEVGARGFARGRVQIRAEMLLRDLVHLVERAALPRVLVGILRAFRHGNAVALGKGLEGFVEAQSFDLHDEVEHVAAGAAAEALVELVRGIDGKRGRLLVMEGAQAGIAVRARPFQPNVLADHADDVDRPLDLLREIHGALGILSRRAMPRGPISW